LFLLNQKVEQALTSSFYTHTAFNSYSNDTPKISLEWLWILQKTIWVSFIFQTYQWTTSKLTYIPIRMKLWDILELNSSGDKDMTFMMPVFLDVNKINNW